MGGAQIRSLNLFFEICRRRNDYRLIINRKLYEISIIKGYNFNDFSDKIIILEIDKFVKSKNVKNKFNQTNKSTLRLFRNKIILLLKFSFYLYKLNLIFKKYKPDYIYAVWVGGMLAWPLKYFYNFKLTYSFNDSGFSSLNNFFIHPLKSENLVIKNADCIDFLSKGLYDELSKLIKINNKTKISISPNSFKNYENFYPEEKKENTVIFLSRMEKIKNPIILLEAIKIFNIKYTESSKINFKFLGDGPLIAEIKKFVNKNKLKNVDILGHINSPEKYLNKSKIFISIQQKNNYPSQSLLEAMASENAIIASDVGETRKLISEDEGLLVELDPNKISNALIFLFKNEKVRNHLAKNARQKVLSEHSVENYLAYFYKLEDL